MLPAARRWPRRCNPHHYCDKAFAEWFVGLTGEQRALDRFLCVDCGKDTRGGEYYMVYDEVWAASGLGPNDGMLCLVDPEKRIGRRLMLDDFAVAPSKDCWDRHTTLRDRR